MAARTKTFWVTEDHWQRAKRLADALIGSYDKQCVIALALADVFPYASDRGRVSIGRRVHIKGLFTTSDYELDGAGKSIMSAFDGGNRYPKPAFPQQVTITKVV